MGAHRRSALGTALCWRSGPELSREGSSEPKPSSTLTGTMDAKLMPASHRGEPHRAACHEPELPSFATRDRVPHLQLWPQPPSLWVCQGVPGGLSVSVSGCQGMG